MSFNLDDVYKFDDIETDDQRSISEDSHSIYKTKSFDSLLPSANGSDPNSPSWNSFVSMTSLLSSDSKKSSLSVQSENDPIAINIEPIEEAQKNICHTKISFSEQRGVLNENKCFCLPCCMQVCSCSYFTWLGWTIFSFGILTLTSFYLYFHITESVHNVEGGLPTYVSGATMTLCGLLTIVAEVRRNKILIICVLVLSLLSTVFCAMSLVHLATEINFRFGQLEDCSFDSYVKICSCYVHRDGIKKLFRFSEVINCRIVQETLRDVVRGVTILFAVGCLISMTTALIACYLLYKEKVKARQQLTVNPPVSNTAQTEESSFTSPRDSFVRPYDKRPLKPPSHFQGNRTVQSDNHFSVSTQTPAYYDYGYGVQSDTEYDLDSLIDHKPPSYNDAIANKQP